MIVRNSVWEEIREEFSAEEMEALHRAWRGEVICPRGFVIHPEALEPALKEKLTRLARFPGFNNSLKK